MKNILIVIAITLFAEGSYQQKLLPSEVADGNVTEFAALEKELPFVNLFKAADDWILRATSDANSLYTRFNLRLEGNRAVASYYLENKLLASPILSHISGSKIIRSDLDGQLDARLIPLHQDHKIIAYIKVCKDNKRILRVLASHRERVDDDCIRRLINDIMARPQIRGLLNDLLPSVRYINGDRPFINHAIGGSPLGEADLVDADLMKAVGNWTLFGFSSKTYRLFNKAEVSIENNKIVLQMHNGQQHLGTATLQYVRGSSVIKSEVFMGKLYDPGHCYLPYVDANSFILLAYIRSEPPLVAVFARDGWPFDPEYMKKVISNQMLFSPDVRRTMSEMVPNIVWERTWDKPVKA